MTAASHNARCEQGNSKVPPCLTTVMERLWELLPITNHKVPSPAETQSHLPDTTPARRRASIAQISLERDEHLPEKVATHDKSSALEGTVLYLAYGSNLCAATFLGKRGIKPLSQVNVVVPSLRLTFELPGLPYIEPCFAATRFRTVPSGESDEDGFVDGGLDTSETSPLNPSDSDSDADKPLVGVVYEVTVSDYARIIATEGGGRGYRDVVVDCYAFPKSYDPADPIPDRPDTIPFKAHTLLAPTGDENGDNDARRVLAQLWSPFLSRPNPNVRPCVGYAQPSVRYLGLIATGAAEHNLPLSYRKYLSQITPYRITSTRQRIGQVMFVSIWAPFMLMTLTLSRALAGPDGRSPSWLNKVSDLMFYTMWTTYDKAFLVLFGDGERTLESVQ